MYLSSFFAQLQDAKFCATSKWALREKVLCRRDLVWGGRIQNPHPKQWSKTRNAEAQERHLKLAPGRTQLWPSERRDRHPPAGGLSGPANPAVPPLPAPWGAPGSRWLRKWGVCGHLHSSPRGWEDRERPGGAPNPRAPSPAPRRARSPVDQKEAHPAHFLQARSRPCILGEPRPGAPPARYVALPARSRVRRAEAPPRHPRRRSPTFLTLRAV